MRLKLLLLLSLISFTVLPAAAHCRVVWEGEEGSQVAAMLEIADNPVSTSDPLQLKVTLSYPATHSPDWARFRQSLTRSLVQEKTFFSLLEEKILPPIEEKGVLTQKAHFTLEVWEAGIINLGPLTLNLQPLDQGSLSHHFFPPPIPINVARVAPTPLDLLHQELLPLSQAPKIGLDRNNQQRLHEQEAKVEQESQEKKRLLEQRQFPWKMALFIASIVGAIALLRPWIKRVFEQMRLSRARRKDPRQAALLEIAALERENYPERAMFELFFVKLTTICRVYIEGQYSIRAEEATTEEFLHETTKLSALDHEVRKSLSEFIQEADLVKFAKLLPTDQECKRAIHAALAFVKHGKE